MTQPLENDILLLLGCTGVNCFWNVGAKIAESSAELRDRDCDSDTDSESAEPASKKKTKFTKDVLQAAKIATKQYNDTHKSDYFLLFICIYNLLSVNFWKILVSMHAFLTVNGTCPLHGQ